MANTTLNMQLLLRRDQTFTSTYVLEAGEPGFEISTNTLKIGDGTKTWAELPIANKEAIDALIKIVDDKVTALNNTFATDKELADGLALKADLATYNAYVEAHANDYTNTQIDEAVAGAKTHAETKISDFNTNTVAPIAADVATIKGDYTTAAQAGTIAQGKVDDFNTTTITPLAERVTAAENTLKTHGDIVTHNVAEFETAGAAAEAEGRVNETLKNYYTKTEADEAFTTPAEVIAEVNKALAEVSDADSITNITTLVNYANEQGADLTALITEVYGSAEMTGDSRLDTIEAKAAMGITADDIAAWNAEKGVKAVVDANKATWDKAGTALQAADLDDYAKTADVVTNEEFNAFNNGTSKTVADIEADIVSKVNAAQAAAEGKATELNTAMDTRVTKLENNEAGYATKTYVDTQDADILAQAKAYADGKEHKNTTYTVAATANALEFTVTPSEGDTQTVTLVAPTVDTGVMEIEAGNDIVVTPGEDGKVTVAHETFTTGEYTRDPATSDKDGDQYFFTSVTVDNGHVTGANVKSLASVLEAMTFVLDGGTSAE